MAIRDGRLLGQHSAIRSSLLLLNILPRPQPIRALPCMLPNNIDRELLRQRELRCELLFWSHIHRHRLFALQNSLARLGRLRLLWHHLIGLTTERFAPDGDLILSEVILNQRIQYLQVRDIAIVLLQLQMHADVRRGALCCRAATHRRALDA